jgi:phosphate transport system permease protein
VIARSRGRVAPSHRRRDRVLDNLFIWGTGAAVLFVVSLVGAVAYLLVQQSLPTIRLLGPGFLTGTEWNAPATIFGALPIIYGTLITSAIGLLIGVPISLGIAMFLSEEAPGWLRTPLAALVELLAAVPSVIYGLWGIFVLAPWMYHNVNPVLASTLGTLPGIGPAFATRPSGGFDLLTAGVILGIMVIPTISAISREAMTGVPRSQREAALALGATRWETTRTAVLPYANSGIIGAIVLGLGRALGETMAVTMTIGNQINGLPTSLLGEGQTIASAIANEINSTGYPIERTALIEAGLVLLLVTLMVNVVARLLVRRAYKGGEASA